MVDSVAAGVFCGRVISHVDDSHKLAIQEKVGPVSGLKTTRYRTAFLGGHTYRATFTWQAKSHSGDCVLLADGTFARIQAFILTTYNAVGSSASLSISCLEVCKFFVATHFAIVDSAPDRPDLPCAIELPEEIHVHNLREIVSIVVAQPLQGSVNRLLVLHQPPTLPSVATT